MTTLPWASVVMLVGYSAHCKGVRTEDRRPVGQRVLHDEAAPFRISSSQGKKLTLGSSSKVVRISIAAFFVDISSGGLWGVGFVLGQEKLSNTVER